MWGGVEQAGVRVQSYAATGRTTFPRNAYRLTLAGTHFVGKLYARPITLEIPDQTVQRSFQDDPA